MFDDVIQHIKRTFNSKDGFIPLHEPRFIGNEKKYLIECLDSTFVSSIGKFVNRFEDDLKGFVGAKHSVATSCGTAALHVALHAIGVEAGDEVITQPLSFVATCNAISYANASPVFVDVDLDTLGMSPVALKNYLVEYCKMEDGICINKTTGNKIKACVPMHSFGFPCRIDEIVDLCEQWNIVVIEDAAESLGSYYKKKHTGTFGKLGVFSFNGNKIVTAGGGGVIVTNDEELAKRIKHLTTTAKIPHKWEYKHDELGFNYRMPNLNASLLCAQLEMLSGFVSKKRELAANYEMFFKEIDINFVSEPKESKSNYWLNTLLLGDLEERNQFLDSLNSNNVMTRPAWELMNTLPMFKQSEKGSLTNAVYLADRIVNIPSSVIV